MSTATFKAFVQHVQRRNDAVYEKLQQIKQKHFWWDIRAHAQYELAVSDEMDLAGYRNLVELGICEPMDWLE